MTTIKRKRLFINTQRSSRRKPYSSDEIDLGHLSHMYSEDWHLGMTPFNEPTFKVEVNPPSAKNELISLLKRHGYDDTVERAIESFLKEVVQLMFLDGKAMYEIHNDDGSGPPSLSAIDPTTIEFDDSDAIQTVPEHNRYAIEETRIVGLKESLFTIEIPDWIEGGRGFDAVVSSLKLESYRSRAPTKFLGLRNSGQETFFEFDVFHKQSMVDTLRLTKESGWDMRQTANNNITEFYWVHRALRFKTNQARLREHIINKLNSELFPAIKQLGMGIIGVELKGLRSYQDLLKIQVELQNGNVGFFEALDLKKDGAS